MAYTAELLVREVVTVAPSEPILEVARLMRRKHIGCVVVAEGGKIAGIFSERDLVNRVVAEAVDPQQIPVSRVMTAAPVTVESSEPLERVFAVLARRRFRHVPITKDGRPVGMVSLSDFVGVLGEVFSEERYVQYFADYFNQEASAR
ncbi:MAG: CBS domain-containing protein [Elusimicrobiota bacterium]